MEQLNDDCLVTIFELVKLTDQLALAQACRRFKLVLQDYIWSHERRYEMLDFDKLAMDLEQFHAYVTCVLPCVEMIDFNNIPKDLFRVMIGHCFPNVRALKFKTTIPLVDEQLMITLSGIFPNLKNLTPHARIRGECLVHFEKVESLTLGCCVGVELQHFIAAIRVLKLKSLELGIFPMTVSPLGEDLRHLHGLELLGVNKHEVTWLLEPNAATVFTHLREIIVFDEMFYEQIQRLFEFLCVLNGGNVSFLGFHYSKYLCYILRETCYSFYARLEKMYFFKMRSSTHLKFGQDIRTRFPALRKVFFYECMLKKVADVLKFLESDLELLHIEDCTTHFKKLRIPVESITANRQRPITLNFNDNFYRKSQYDEGTPVILEYEETEFFKVTQLESIYHPYGTMCICLE